MKKLLLLSAMTLSALSNVQAFENKSELNSHGNSLIDSHVSALIESHTNFQGRINYELAPVKNRGDLNKLLKTDSALDLLSEPAKNRFTDSLIFSKNGLSGFNYVDLEAELTPKEIYQILSLFGAQQYISIFENARIETSADYLLVSPQSGQVSKDFKLGHWCKSGKCVEAKGYACTSNCK